MATDIISAYRSVCMDLEGLEAYMPAVRTRLEMAHRTMYKGRMPSSGSICYVPLDTAVEEFNRATEDYNETLKTIEQLRMVKGQLERTISSMSEVEQVVILLHVEQGLNLREIAEKSNYSYDYLRRIARNLKQEVTKSPLSA